MEVISRLVGHSAAGTRGTYIVARLNENKFVVSSVGYIVVEDDVVVFGRFFLRRGGDESCQHSGLVLGMFESLGNNRFGHLDHV